MEAVADLVLFVSNEATPPKKKAKIRHLDPSLDGALSADCIGVVVTFFSISDVSRFESTCKTIQSIVRYVSEEVFEQFAYDIFSEQHVQAVQPVSGERPWRERLKHQVVSKRRPKRTEYSLEDFGIAISMELPDLTSYYENWNDDNDVFETGMDDIDRISGKVG